MLIYDVKRYVKKGEGIPTKVSNKLVLFCFLNFIFSLSKSCSFREAKSMKSLSKSIFRTLRCLWRGDGDGCQIDSRPADAEEVTAGAQLLVQATLLLGEQP